MSHIIATLDLKRLLQVLEHLRQVLQNARRNREAFLRRYPFVRWLLRAIGAVILLGALAITGFLMSIRYGAFGPLPSREDLSEISNPLAAEVYAADSTLLGRYYLEHRSNVKYEHISPDFINALVATEDARFFKHHGVDVRAWGRVFFKTILQKDESAGGGSTITQQLVKNLYPRQNYGKYSIIINKLKEAFIAMRVESMYSKQEILEMYLNTVSFSENTYGIKVASQRFFGVQPDSLSAVQSAVLVAMLKATTTYNPVSNPEQSLERRNLVLQLMQQHGYLQQSEADSLQSLPLGLHYKPFNHNEGIATYFREHLRLELKDILKDYRKPNGMAYNVYTDGLKIYTTIDAGMQRAAEAAVQEHMAQLQKDFIQHLRGAPAWENDTILILAKQQSPRYRRMIAEGHTLSEIDSVMNMPIEMTIFDWNGRETRKQMSPMDSIKYYLSLFNAGFLAAEPQSGAIKAWVGGIDYKYFQYDHVKSRRQAGSTFKPIVYATALEQGTPPCTYTSNQLRSYPQYQNWTPKNADGKYGGSYSLEGGLIHSVNTVTVSLAMRAGSRNVANMAEALGMEGPVPGSPAIALGAYETALLDMVRVYGTFANGGKRPELYYIKRIETARGRVVYQHWIDRARWAQPLSKDHATMMTQMLRSAVDNGTGRRLRYRYKFTHDIAGKTGTSQNHSDGWFIGYTPTLVAGVWVGAESPSVRFRDLSLGQGANMALPIYALFTQKLLARKEYESLFQARFPIPSEEVQDALNCATTRTNQPSTNTVNTVDVSTPSRGNPAGTVLTH